MPDSEDRRRGAPLIALAWPALLAWLAALVLLVAHRQRLGYPLRVFPEHLLDAALTGARLAAVLLGAGCVLFSLVLGFDRRTERRWAAVIVFLTGAAVLPLATFLG